MQNLSGGTRFKCYPGPFSSVSYKLIVMAILNNIKNVLSEKGVMSKWLAKQLQKDPATVSKWCNNHSQPDLYTFVRIANLLDVDVHELICHTKK